MSALRSREACRTCSAILFLLGMAQAQTAPPAGDGSMNAAPVAQAPNGAWRHVLADQGMFLWFTPADAIEAETVATMFWYDAGEQIWRQCEHPDMWRAVLRLADDGFAVTKILDDAAFHDAAEAALVLSLPGGNLEAVSWVSIDTSADDTSAVEPWLIGISQYLQETDWPALSQQGLEGDGEAVGDDGTSWPGDPHSATGGGGMQCCLSLIDPYCQVLKHGCGGLPDCGGVGGGGGSGSGCGGVYLPCQRCVLCCTSCCGGSCCHGACCGGQCCGSTCCGHVGCCGGPCCGGTCCPGGTCCNGACCGGTCCNGNCCPPGGSCCNGGCCSGECCNGACCTGGECCDGVCLPPGQICCNGTGCQGTCINDECCTTPPCGGQCCGGTCCEGQCCPSGSSCCGGQCCDQPCCAGECCSSGDREALCCDDSCEDADCSISVEDGEVCPGGTVQLEATGSCSPSCYSMTVFAFGNSEFGSAYGSVSVPCDGQPYTGTITITGNPDAPIGAMVEFFLFGAGDGLTCSIFGNAVVRQLVNLSLGGVAEADEETPGGFLCVNDDDDNNNGTPDRDEFDPQGQPTAVVGENDLVPLEVTADGTLEGTLTLSATGNSAALKVYENADRTGPVTLPKMWTLPGSGTDLDVTYYVEGVGPSNSARDVNFVLSFTGNGGPCMDVVKATVVQVDFDITGTDDGTEATPPGIAVAANNYFHAGHVGPSGNPLPDNIDAQPISADHVTVVRQGLVPCTLAVRPTETELLEGATVRVQQTGGSGGVWIYAIRPGVTAVRSGDWTIVPFGVNLVDDFFRATGAYHGFQWYLEGVDPGSVELLFEFLRDGVACRDSVLLNVVEYRVVELRYKSFIACNAIATGFNPMIIDWFAGDDRNFGYSGSPSRSFQSYYVTIGLAMPNGPVIDPASEQHFGTTHGYNDQPSNIMPCAPGQVCAGYCTSCIAPGATTQCVQTAQPGAGSNVLTGVFTRTTASQGTFQLDLVGKNPCSSFAPAIDAHITFEFRQVYESITGVLQPMEWRVLQGQHDGFPWHETYLNTTVVYKFDPCGLPSGPDPESLFPPAEIDPLLAPDWPNLDQWRPVP